MGAPVRNLSPGAPPRSTVVSRVTRQATPFPGATAGRGVGRVSVGDTTPSRTRSPKQGQGAGQGHPQALGLPAAWRPVSRDLVSSHDSTCRFDGHRHSGRRRGHAAQLPRPAGQGHPQAGGAGSPHGRWTRVAPRPAGQGHHRVGRSVTASRQAGRWGRVTPRPARRRSGLRQAGRPDRVTPRPVGGGQGRAQLGAQGGRPVAHATAHRLGLQWLVCGMAGVQGGVGNEEVTATAGRTVGRGGGRRVASRWGLCRFREV